MLQFFRKHQKYFFAVITFMVVLSFSFFGTYDTLGGNAIHEQIAFKAIDGAEITRGELEAMVTFLGTDSEDKRLFGGVWGPNFLNDGVIKMDFLSTGLADILVAAYPALVDPDLESKLEKEKRFTLYSHPQAKFLSVETAWEYFAPSMRTDLNTLRKAPNAISKEAFAARVSLFLNERRFPPSLLKQVLRYQQKQQSWLTPDQNLDYTDLSLFGYHTLDDWFGSRFVHLIAEFIINSSKIAEAKGYKVTKEEALADLLQNAEISYKQNLENPQLGVANSTEYMNEQLRLLAMDRSKAAKVWQQVLLFRRLFHDVGNSTLVDALTNQKFSDYAKEAVAGDLYRLPLELQISDYRALQKFEVYLYAVAKRARLDKMNDKEMLSLPNAFLTVDEVKKKYPELVQKKYNLEVAQVNKNMLQSKIGLKDMWNWEVDNKNWEVLKKEFPELGIKAGSNREERFAALDSLDDKTRSRIDAFARNAIIDSHPEWLVEALKTAEPKRMAVGISTTGGTSFIAGLSNREELILLLDQAVLQDDPKGKLANFSGNGINFYRIKVLERAPNDEIMTFADANKDKVLDGLLDQVLESHYQKIRGTNPTAFQNEDKSWKEYAEVKNLVADQYFDKLLAAIKAEAKQEGIVTGDRSASLRFFAYMRDAQSQIQQGAPEAADLVKNDQDKGSLASQWKLEKVSYRVDRSSNDDMDTAEMFTLAPNAWTSIQTPVNGNLYFFKLKNKEKGNSDISAAYDKLHEAHRIVSDDAQRTFAYSVIKNLKEKNSISLDYLNRGEESISPDVALQP